MNKINIIVMLFSFIFFNCQKKSILKSDKIKNHVVIKEEKTFLSDLKGSWAVSCDNGLTTFNINKDEGLISLYGNSIYIKVQVEKRFENEYILKFKQIADQKDWVDTSLRITESEISKDKIIGKFFIKKDGKVELHWEGLYNIKKTKNRLYWQRFFIK